MPFDAWINPICEPICRTWPMSCCNFAVMRALAETLKWETLDEYLVVRTKKCESQCWNPSKDMIKRVKYVN